MEWWKRENGWLYFVSAVGFFLRTESKQYVYGHSIFHFLSILYPNLGPIKSSQILPTLGSSEEMRNYMASLPASSIMAQGMAQHSIQFPITEMYFWAVREVPTNHPLCLWNESTFLIRILQVRPSGKLSWLITSPNLLTDFSHERIWS